MNSENEDSAIERQTVDIMKMDRQIIRRIQGRRVLRALAWGGLMALGVRQRGVIGFGVAAYAVTRLARLLGERRSFEQGSLLPEAVLSHSVDHASRESFPASDPPAHATAVS